MVAEDVQIRNAVLAWLLGFEKLLHSKVQTTLLPSNSLGLNCRVPGVTPGLCSSRCLQQEKEKQMVLASSSGTQVPATQSGKHSGASGDGICPGAWERLCGPFKAVLLLWKYF